MLYTAAQLVAILSSISKWEIVVWCLQSWRLHWGWWSTQCKMAEDCTSRNCMTFYNIRQKWKTRKYSSPSHLTHPVWVTWLNKLSKCLNTRTNQLLTLSSQLTQFKKYWVIWLIGSESIDSLLTSQSLIWLIDESLDSLVVSHVTQLTHYWVN